MARLVIFPCLLPLVAAGPGAASARASALDGPGGAGVLVAFPTGTPAEQRSAVHARAGGQVRETLEEERVDVVDVDSGSLAEALASYRAEPVVHWAEPNRKVTIEGRASDPLFPGNSAAATDLWGLHNEGQHGGLADADVDAPEAWDLAALPDDYAVGIVDTGVDAGHEDLAGRVVPGCMNAVSGNGTLSAGCADDQGHGTHVAGTIAAAANNGLGVAGVAPGARVLPCKALDHRGEGRVSDIVACVNHLVAVAPTHNLRVISMSLGGPEHPAEAAAVRHAWSSGVLLVAAAGNEGTGAVNYPAGYAEAVSVAATDRMDERASFSNANGDVEISAPGVAVVSTVPGGYASWSGTSMATPHVAAAAAAVARRYGGSAQEVRDRLAQSADDLGAPGRDDAFGHGRLNLCRALGGTCGYGPGRPPVAAFSVSGGKAVAQAFSFDGRRSSATGAGVKSYAWDLDGDGKVDATGPRARTSYASAGRRRVTLTVTDAAGATASATKTVTVRGGDARAPRLRGGLPARYGLRAAVREGIRQRCSVDERATCRLVAEIDPKLARKARVRSLGRRVSRSAPVVIAQGSESVRAGQRGTVVARLSSSAQRALRGLRSVEVTLRVTATDAAGNTATAERAAVLRGS
jgi:thermitase